MKLPQIIAELKAAIANDCATVILDGRCIAIEGYPDVSLHCWFESRGVDRRYPNATAHRRLHLMTRWATNWLDMDYAVFGDGRTRRQKWIRKWLLREFGLGGGVKRSDRVWMEAANA